MSESLPPASESRLHTGSEFPVEFVRQHVRTVLALIFNLVGDLDQAQELTQETFIKVFQRKGPSTRLKKAAALLPGIATETANSWLRDRLRQGRRAPLVTAGERKPAVPESAAEWGRLEREVLGNIAVGLAAAHCIERVGARPRFLRTRIIAIVCLAILFLMGWLTHIPSEQTQHLFASLRKAMGSPRTSRLYARTESGTRGIASNSSDGARLLLQTPSVARVWASGKSEISASFTDEQTGQVVVTTVYGQEDSQ